MPAPAFAQHTPITISGDVKGSVFGNGTQPDCASPPMTATVTGYSVIINSGGKVTGTVDGGWATNSGGDASATGNSVTINDGEVNGQVDGGYAGATGSSTVTGNFVTIKGGTVSGNIYGGFVSGTGSATGNIVTITATGKTYQNIYGGNTGSGTDNRFTGNTLNLAANNTSINSVQNFEFINFTSAGNAGIATLDTTPTGATGTPLVKLNIGTNDINFDGIIVGNTDNSGKWGGIEKTGTGTLTLSGDSSTYAGSTTITAGTLALTSTAQLGGNVTTAGAALTVEQGAAINGDLNATGRHNEFLGAGRREKRRYYVESNWYGGYYRLNRQCGLRRSKFPAATGQSDKTY
ncbi:hypothetical protein FACS189454_08540 [Planctomycetales bacterium]|nr:hypothetical protein FACS189454_08540 [Planctomycetales bacterium]